ncbi:Protein DETOXIFICATION 16, partial [Mucuna pruriens]
MASSLEMWSFELMVLLSGLLPNPKLETSVLSIWLVFIFEILNTSAAVWMIPFGLSGAGRLVFLMNSIHSSCSLPNLLLENFPLLYQLFHGSCSIRVSNELGAGRPWTARLAVRVVVVIAIIEGILIGTLMILIRNIWGYAYSNEVEVVKYVATMFPILAASNFLDGIQCVLSGAARGCGWQKIGAFVNLGSYYLVGVPSAIVLAFVLDIGGKGLWLGIICALIVQVCSLMIITIRTDWEQEAKKATDRVYNSITTESL